MKHQFSQDLAELGTCTLLFAGCFVAAIVQNLLWIFPGAIFLAFCLLKILAIRLRPIKTSTNDIRVVLALARSDFSYFFRTKWLMAVLLSLNLSDMLVVALVYRGMMSFNYFAYFVPAVIIMGLFAASLDTGRRIWLALREGVIQYELSLPVSIQGLVVAYLIAGGCAALVYSSSLMAIALVVLPAQSIVSAVMLLPFLFVLAMGLAGISGGLAALASTHGEFFWAFQNILQGLLLTLSTVYYPIENIEKVMPSFIVAFVNVNPLSLASGALRQYAFQGVPIQVVALAQIIVASIPFAVVGGFAYLWTLHKIQIQGKL